jgi:hypothetical protein
MSIEEQRRLTSARMFRRRTLLAYWRTRPLLSETQRSRLRQLAIRSFQHTGLLHPEVIRELQLTPEEVARLKKTFKTLDPARLTPETRVPKPSEKLSSEEIDAYWARFRLASHQRYVTFLANQAKCDRAMSLQIAVNKRAAWTRMKGRPLVSREAGEFASLDAATRQEVYRARVGEKWQTTLTPDERDRKARVWMRALTPQELTAARRRAIERAGPIACLWPELARVAKLTSDQQEELLRVAMDQRVRARLTAEPVGYGARLSNELRQAYARVLGSK